MSGQPTLPGWLEFDVTAVTASDIIIQVGALFDVSVEFDGSGWIWGGMEAAGEPYTATFYMEGIGAAAPEVDLGTATGNLGAGPYTATLTGISVATAGVYRLACMVQLDNYQVVTGFIEGLLVQVHP